MVTKLNINSHIQYMHAIHSRDLDFVKREKFIFLVFGTIAVFHYSMFIKCVHA